MQKALRSLSVALLAISFIVMAPIAARAQTAAAPSVAGLFSLSQADAPIQWAENIFLGKSAPDQETFLNCQNCSNNNASGVVQTGLQTILSMYSNGMLVLGSFMLLYYLLKNVAETAHTGKPGGRINTLWGPIRMVLAIGLLVPLPSGLNSGQYIVINIAKEGSALASNAWNAFGNTIVQASQGVFAQAQPSGQDQVVQTLLQNYVCELYYNAELSGAHITDASQTVVETTSTVGNQTVISFGNASDAVICGSISYPTPLSASNASNPDAAVYAAVLQGQYDALQAAKTTLKTMAANFVSTYYPPNVQPSSFTAPSNADIQQAINTYNQTLVTAASKGLQAASGQIQAALTSSNPLGWLSAGSFFLTVARLQNAVISAANTAPHVIGPDLDTLSMLSSSGLTRATHDLGAADSNAAAIEAGIADTQVQLATGPSAIYRDVANAIGMVRDIETVVPAGGSSGTVPQFVLQGTLIGTTNVTTGSKFGEFIEKITGAVLNVLPGGSLLAGNALSGFPLTALQNLGFDCIKSAVAIYAVGVTGGLFSSGISSLAVMFGSILFAPGVMLAYVLPVLPFIRFLFAIFGWILAYAEAVVSVPVFALAHLNPEGEGLVPQETRQGYLLLLQLLFRPLLIVAGLILALLLMNGMFDFLNAVWMQTVIGANGTVTVNPTTGMVTADIGAFGKIVYGVIYAAITYGICNTCFKAVDYVPNHALRWIGSSSDGYSSGHNEHAPHLETAALATAALGRQFGSSAATTGGQVSRTVGRQVGGALRKGLASAFKGKGGGATPPAAPPGVTAGSGSTTKPP